MPEILTRQTRHPVWRNVAIGFCGKLPARGDFVRLGLPRTFAEPWDLWMRRMIVASRAALDEAWLPAWLEAPVWRFALSPGICGPDAVIGLWMPSVDRVGRYFPLTIAAVAPHCDLSDLVREGGGFLTAAEDAGRDALNHDLTPSEVAVHLTAAPSLSEAGPGDAGPTPCSRGGGLWWTRGSPRVPAGLFENSGLPDEHTFIAMVNPCHSLSPAPSPL
jgi:type VI secretion system protein ImpM